MTAERTVPLDPDTGLAFDLRDDETDPPLASRRPFTTKRARQVRLVSTDQPTTTEEGRQMPASKTTINATVRILAWEAFRRDFAHHELSKTAETKMWRRVKDAYLRHATSDAALLDAAGLLTTTPPSGDPDA